MAHQIANNVHFSVDNICNKRKPVQSSSVNKKLKCHDDETDDNCNDNVTFHQCQQCSGSFRSAHLLSVHCSFKHACKTSETCDSEVVNNYDCVQFSMSMQVKYECTCCKLTFASLEDGRVHIENNHNEGGVEIVSNEVQVLQCRHCGCVFDSPEQCNQHKATQCQQTLVQRFYCPHCSSHFANRNSCIKHMKQEHCQVPKTVIHTQMTTMYKCYQCLELLETTEMLDKHVIECKDQAGKSQESEHQEENLQIEPPLDASSSAGKIYETPQSFTLQSGTSAFEEPPTSYLSASEPPSYYQAQSVLYAPVPYHLPDTPGYVIQPQVTMVPQDAPVLLYPQPTQAYFQPDPVNYMEHYQSLGKAFIEMQHQAPPVSSTLQMSTSYPLEEKFPNTWENNPTEPPQEGNSKFSIREVKVARFHCTSCTYHFSMRHHCVRHLQASHDIKVDSRSVYSKMTTMFECQKCLRYFQTTKLVESHICRKLSTSNKDAPFSRTSVLHYFCPLCDQHFPGGPSCRRHITLTHSQVPNLEDVYRGIVTKLCSLWICHICSTLRMKYFDCKASLAEHMTVHNVTVDSSEQEDEEELSEKSSEENNSNSQWVLPQQTSSQLTNENRTYCVQDDKKMTQKPKKKVSKKYKTVVENDIMSDFISYTQVLYVCPVCDIRNSMEFNTLHHIQTQHPDVNTLTVEIPTVNKPVFKCKSCHGILSSIQECKDHKLVGCGSTSQSSSPVNEVRIERIHCPLCSQHFAMRHHCTRHISKAHGETSLVKELVSKVTTMYKCPKCSKLYHSIDSLEGHISRCKIEYTKQQSTFSKVKDELYFCPKCIQYFTSLYLCKRHISLVHPESELIGKDISSKMCSVWICHLCSSLRKKYFDKKSVLISHMKKHKIEVDIESLQDEDGSESEDISIVSDDDDESTCHSIRSETYPARNEEDQSPAMFRGEPWQSEKYEPPPYLSNNIASQSQLIDNVSMDFYSTNASQMPVMGYPAQEYVVPVQPAYIDTLKQIKQEVGTETLSFGFQILNSMSPSTESETQNINSYPQCYETLTPMQPAPPSYSYECYNNVQYSSYESQGIEVQNSLLNTSDLPDSTTNLNDEDFQAEISLSFQSKESMSLQEVEAKFSVQLNRSHCPLCTQHFCYPHDCTHHIKTVHPTQLEAAKHVQTQSTTMYKCETCDKLCVTPTVLLNHLPKCKYTNVEKVGAYSKVYEKRYFCPHCVQHFRNSSLCERHISLVHKNVPAGLSETIEQKMCYIFVCHLCSSLRTKYFDSEALIQEHMLKHKNQLHDKDGEIPTSEENSRDQEVITYDNYSSSYPAEPNQWQSDSCTQQPQNYIYEAPNDPQPQMSTESEAGPAGDCVVQVERAHCPLCHQHFSHPHNCMMHIKSNHPESISRLNEYSFKKTDMYKCHKCDRLHLSMTALENHLNACKNVKTNKTDMFSKMVGFRYFCPECQLHFSTVSMCKRHVTGSHPSKVEELCDRVEKRSCEMWICHICSSLKTKCFVTKAALVEHMLKHSINVESGSAVQEDKPMERPEESFGEAAQSTSYYDNVQVNYNEWQPANNFQLVSNESSGIASEFYEGQQPQFGSADVSTYQTTETNSVAFFNNRTQAESYMEQHCERESAFIKTEASSSQDESQADITEPQYLESNSKILDGFTCYSRLNFPCPFCSKVYKAEASTLEHIKAQHETESYYLSKVAPETEEVYECKACHAKVNSPDLCVKHKTTCSDTLSQQNPCENENFYVTHSTDTDKEYQCKTCMKMFYTVKASIEHNSTCHRDTEKLPQTQTVRVMRYYCSICFAHHSHRHHCYRHMVNIHGASSDALKNITYLETVMYKCEKCCKLIHSMALFKKHNVACKKCEKGAAYGKIKRTRWYCPRCDQHFACDGHCKRHIKLCHSEDCKTLYADIYKKIGYLWICHLCSTLRTKILDSRDSLVEHMLKHNIQVLEDSLDEHDTDEASSPDMSDVMDSCGEESMDFSEVQQSPPESSTNKTEFKRTTRSSKLV